MHALELTVLLIAALATGGLMVNWVGLARAMAKLSPFTYIELHQTTNRTFQPYMPVVVVGAIVGGIALAVACGIRTASGRLSAFGAVGYMALIAISVPDVRINKQVACWSIENPPGDWAAVRARWIGFHVIRTLFFGSRVCAICSGRDFAHGLNSFLHQNCIYALGGGYYRAGSDDRHWRKQWHFV